MCVLRILSYVRWEVLIVRLIWCPAGKPSLVFDCIYNSGVKARTLRDPEFKVFLVGAYHFLSSLLSHS